MAYSDLDIPTQTFTAAQRLAMYQRREALILMGAQEYATMSKSAKAADLKEIRAAITALQQEISDADAAAAASGGGGNVLVRLNPAS